MCQWGKIYSDLLTTRYCYCVWLKELRWGGRVPHTSFVTARVRLLHFIEIKFSTSKRRYCRMCVFFFYSPISYTILYKDVSSTCQPSAMSAHGVRFRARVLLPLNNGRLR